MKVKIRSGYRIPTYKLNSHSPVCDMKKLCQDFTQLHKEFVCNC
jgi:hypothetical protein